MTHPLAEVREDDVIKLFRSMPFRRSLRQAAAFTKRTGYESAFRVARDFYCGLHYVSGILEGTTEDCKVKNRTYTGELSDFDFGEQKVSSDRCYRFLSLHFHPDTTKCPIPSFGDLRTAQTALEDWEAYEQVDVRPIIAVAHVLEDDRILALVYQKTIEGDIEQMHDFQDLDSILSTIDFPDPSYVVACLEKSGLFYADILTLEKKYAYRPNNNDYHKLKRFVHTPRRQSVASKKTRPSCICRPSMNAQVRS